MLLKMQARLLAHKANRELSVLKALKEILARKVLLALKATKVMLVRKVTLARKELKATKESQPM
jgi:hypothetical protein